MMSKLSAFLFVIFMSFMTPSVQGQTASPAQLDSMNREILLLRQDVQRIQMNLSETRTTLKRGVFVATIGYTVTIIGGQLLGTNPLAGEFLLYTGGGIGICGTAVLVRGFNKLGVRKKTPRYIP